MTGADVRHVFDAMFPPDESERLCTPCGVIERPRTRDLGMLVRAMVISTGTPGGAYPADVLRSYLEGEVPRITRSAFQRWCDEALARCMPALAALAYARAPQVELSGPLAGVQDWYIVASTTVRVRDARQKAYPGTGEYAAIKVHNVLSVGGGAPVLYPCSPAREHDSRHLASEASWRGYGLLADLGDASLARLRACETQGVRFVSRLQDTWQPKVDDSARDQVSQTFGPGPDLETLLAQDILLRAGRAIDADVQVGGGTHPHLS